jgi:hypothetical protein
MQRGPPKAGLAPSRRGNWGDIKIIRQTFDRKRITVRFRHGEGTVANENSGRRSSSRFLSLPVASLRTYVRFAGHPLGGRTSRRYQRDPKERVHFGCFAATSPNTPLHASNAKTSKTAPSTFRRTLARLRGCAPSAGVPRMDLHFHARRSRTGSSNRETPDRRSLLPALPMGSMHVAHPVGRRT